MSKSHKSQEEIQASLDQLRAQAADEKINLDVSVIEQVGTVLIAEKLSALVRERFKDYSIHELLDLIQLIQPKPDPTKKTAKKVNHSHLQ